MERVYRATPVPMPGYESNRPGDLSGVWRVKVEYNEGRGWELWNFYYEGVPYKEALRRAGVIENRLNSGHGDIYEQVK